jgi:hypothetical protein
MFKASIWIDYLKVDHELWDDLGQTELSRRDVFGPSREEIVGVRTTKSNY